MEKLEKVCVYKKTLKEAHEIIKFLYGMVITSDLSQEQHKDIKRINIRLKNLSKSNNSGGEVVEKLLLEIKMLEKKADAGMITEQEERKLTYAKWQYSNISNERVYDMEQLLERAKTCEKLIEEGKCIETRKEYDYMRGYFKGLFDFNIINALEYDLVRSNLRNTAKAKGTATFKSSK